MATESVGVMRLAAAFACISVDNRTRVSENERDEYAKVAG